MSDPEASPSQAEPRSSSDDDWGKSAVEKAERLRRAQRRSDRSLYTLAHVGALAWMFLLPVLLASWIAHLALRDSAQRWLALPLLLLGVLIGGALVRRKILSLLEERDDDADR